MSEGDFPRTRPTRSQATLIGAAAGTVASACGSILYLLLWMGWLVTWNLTAHVNGSGPITVPDLTLGTAVMGIAGAFWILVIAAALGMPPALALSALTGAFLGFVLSVTKRWQGPVRAWLTGMFTGYVVAMTFNVVLLRSRLDSPLNHDEYLEWIGIPSAIFVLGMGPVAVWIHRRLAKLYD